MTDAKPYPKAAQLGRAERRYRRKVASPKQWAAFRESMRGENCRVCRFLFGTSLHHIVPRDFGGDDVLENLAPLCLPCHILVTHREPDSCRLLCASLTDAEYAYAVEKVGENVWERVYGIEYGR